MINLAIEKCSLWSAEPTSSDPWMSFLNFQEYWDQVTLYYLEISHYRSFTTCSFANIANYRSLLPSKEWIVYLPANNWTASLYVYFLYALNTYIHTYTHIHMYIYNVMYMSYARIFKCFSLLICSRVWTHHFQKEMSSSTRCMWSPPFKKRCTLCESTHMESVFAQLSFTVYW